MKTLLLICGTLAWLSAPAIAENPPTIANPPAAAVAKDPALGQHIPAFTAETTTVSGDAPRTAKFDSSKTDRVTAYIFIGSTCPATNAYIDRFKELEHQYTPKGVDFVYLYPNRTDTHDVQLKFHKEKGFGGPLIDDNGAHLAELFKAKRTTEIFLADKKGMVVFHGAVDDAREPRAVTKRYLAPALDEVLAGKQVTTATSDVNA